METIETGDFRFEVIDNWGVLPDGWSAGVVTGVVVDSEDRVYVCQQQRDPRVLRRQRLNNFALNLRCCVVPRFDQQRRDVLVRGL